MLIAIFITILGSLPLGFLTEDDSNRWLVYLLAPFTGVGLVIMLNTATSLISDVVGKDTKNSAFVYGCYSLADKFANGFLLFYLVKNYSKSDLPLRVIMTVVPISCSIGAFVFTLIGNIYFSDKMAKITGIQE